jgi:predicted alpha/beta superfamily hydrolase
MSFLNIHALQMPQLARERSIRVLLPRNYNQTDKPFPVLYMQDGQNLFDPETAAFGDWHIPKTMDKLPLKKQVIIVGIDNGGDDRINEYAPFKKGKSGGEGDAYVRFIIETVKPFIDNEYRTMPQRETTGIAGSSMGGLIALYAGLKYRNVFGKTGVLSPSIWFNPKVLDLIKETPQYFSQFYVCASKREMQGMEATLEKIYWAFKNAGYNDEQIRVVIQERGKHNEFFWSREFKPMLEWLFGMPSLLENLFPTKITNV